MILFYILISNFSNRYWTMIGLFFLSKNHTEKARKRYIVKRTNELYCFDAFLLDKRWFDWRFFHDWVLKWSVSLVHFLTAFISLVHFLLPSSHCTFLNSFCIIGAFSNCFRFICPFLYCFVSLVHFLIVFVSLAHFLIAFVSFVHFLIAFISIRLRAVVPSCY